MDSNPYSPPAAALADAAPETLTVRLRSVWLHALVVLVGVMVLLWGRTGVIAGATPLTVLATLAIIALLAVVPLRIIRAARSAAPPWWSDALLCLLLVLPFIGALTGDHAPVSIAFFSLTGLNLVLLIALIITERRRPVRAYSQGRKWIFMSKDTEEIL